MTVRAHLAARAILLYLPCIIVAAGFTASTLARAQSGSKSHFEFEVASVRPSDPNAGGRGGSKAGGAPNALSHGRFNYSESLLGFIVQAYHVTGCRAFPVRDTCPLISGGPAWIDKDRFDVQAKTPEGTPDYTFFQLARGEAPEIQLMLQALLADRFNLKIHREKKQMPVYLLELAKKGPKFKKSGPVGTKQIPGGGEVEDRMFLFRPSVQPNGERTIQLTAKNWPIQSVADTFSSMLQRPVLNRTGLKGEVDFTLEYAADGDQPVSELTGPELFTALPEQAGLTLRATKVVVDVFVIDYAEKPSEN